MDQVLPEGPLKVVTHIRPSHTLHSFLATFRREKVLFDSEEVLDNKLDHPLPFLLALIPPLKHLGAPPSTW